MGSYGWGRIDMVENRRVGIKSREIYECPAALALLLAHSDLEDLTLERDVAHEKARLEPRWAELVYDGMWFSPLKEALDAFFATHPAPRHRRGAPGAGPGQLHGARPAQPGVALRPRPRHLRRGRHLRPRRCRGLRASVGPGPGHVGGAPGRPADARSGSAGRVGGPAVTLWEGRLGGTADEVMAFTASLPYDRRLAADDLAGSRAHVRGLARAGVLEEGEAAILLTALDRVEEELRLGDLRLPGRGRGHPHRRGAPGDRARRRRGGQAPHRPQPQRPGRHRPAPVHAPGAAGAWPPR